MSASRSLDPESLQSLLANAFSVQQSGVDKQSLCAFVEVQRLIASGNVDSDSALHLIAERTRDIANASGIGIALLERNQLVHRAGSGTASNNVGRQLTAVLSRPGSNDTHAEILRVEDAQADSRIEAEICRQFDARALLLIPIYRDRAMSGVLEVFFSEPHTFDEREVRTYHLMASLVGDATSPPAPLPQQKPAVVPSGTVAHALWRMSTESQPVGSHNGPVATAVPEPWVRSVPAKASASLRNLSNRFRAPATNSLTQAVQRVSVYRLPWKLAALPLVATLAIAAGIAHHHNTASPVASSSHPSSDTDVPQPPSSSLTPLANVQPVKAHSTESNPAPRMSKSAFRKVRVGQYEVDYIADDVTIRHFQSPPAAPAARHWMKQVNFGEDVTVRYFKAPTAEH